MEMRGRCHLGVAIVVLLASAGAEDTGKPHSHSGVFRRHKLGPPKQAGFATVTKSVAKRLQASGKAEYTVTALKLSDSSPKGTMRCTSTCYVSTPPTVVWDVLMDLPNYPKFIAGISHVAPYRKKRTLTGGQLVSARYTVRIPPLFKVVYFLDHHYEPLQKSMVWHLDYDRTSDVFDSVGYWHVDAFGSGSIVYYTQDSLLPSWIPRSVRKTFTKAAMSAATAQLGPACRQAMGKQQGRPRLALPQGLQQRLQQLAPKRSAD